MEAKPKFEGFRIPPPPPEIVPKPAPAPLPAAPEEAEMFAVVVEGGL